jgi:hypothetical protein
MKTYEQVSQQDLLNFSDLRIYIRGIGKNSLWKLAHSPDLGFPAQVFGRWWRRVDVDEFFKIKNNTPSTVMSPIAARLRKALP